MPLFPPELGGFFAPGALGSIISGDIDAMSSIGGLSGYHIQLLTACLSKAMLAPNSFASVDVKVFETAELFPVLFARLILLFVFVLFDFLPSA